MTSRFLKQFHKLITMLVVVGLVGQAFIPGSSWIQPARADEFPDTGVYDFEEGFGGVYATGDNALVEGNFAQTRLTWELQSGADIAGAGISSSRLLSPESAGVVLLIDRGNGIAYRSTDSGENWNQILNGTMNVLDMVETTEDGSTTLVAVGDNGANLIIQYSEDFGATWNAATMGFVVPGLAALSATYDAATNDLWVLIDNGTVATSTDGGENWSLTAGVPGFTDSSYEIIAVGNGDLVASGADAGGNMIAYSLDNGDSWTEFCIQVGSVGVCDPDIQTFGLHNGYVYASDQSSGSLFRTLATEPLGWSSINNTPGYIDSFYSTGEILFASSFGNGIVYGSYENGDNWLVEHAEAVAGAEGLGLARLYNDDRFLWVIQDGATTSAYIADPYTSDAWIIPENGFLASEINSINAADFHAVSESTEVSLAFGFTTDPDGTWYYHDGADWVAGVGTDSTFSTPISDLTGSVLQSFDDDVPFTGSIQIRIYLVGGNPDPNPPIIVLDYLEFNYDLATITITHPNGGEAFAVGTQHNITWTSSGGIATVDLEYSIDNGGIWNMIAAGEANDGTYEWTIPNADGNDNLIRISSGAVDDTSDATFEIVSQGGGGGNQGDDEQIPYSDVDEQPPISPNDTLSVTVTAYDNQSGVESVKLYYTYGYEATGPAYLIPFGEPMHGCPEECFEWEFDFPNGEGKYYFYSSAVDFAGNDNFPYKFGGTICEQGPGGWEHCYYAERDIETEAETIFDQTAPFVVGSRPIQNAQHVALGGGLELRMSESVTLDGLDYNFYHYQNGQKVTDMDKIEDPYFPTIPGGGCPPGMYCIGMQPTLTMVFPYSGLAPNTEYHLSIRHLYDFGENDLIKNGYEQPGNLLVWKLSFRTGGSGNPDMSASTLNIETDQKYGFFDEGAVVPFVATLRNESPTPANMATAELTIAPGLTYCTTPTGGQHCAPAFATGGNLTVVQDGDQTRISWVGSVTEGNTFNIYIWVTVDSPAYAPSITQHITIDDGVNDFVIDRHDTVYLLSESKLSSSTKIGSCYVDGTFRRCDRAYEGALVTYAITVVNEGTAPSTTTVVDALPADLGFIEGTLQGDALWDSLVYDSATRVVTAQGTIPPGASFELSFAAEILPDAGDSVTNAASITNDAGGNQLVSFTTTLGADEGNQPPQVAFLSPTPDQTAVGLKSAIQIGFTKSMDTARFGLELRLGDKLISTANWTKSWESRNGKSNALVTLTPPDESGLEIDATYTATIARTTVDLDGNVLAPGPHPNPWSFTTIAPGLRIVEPTQQIVQVEIDKVSPMLVVEAQDINAGTAYAVEEDIQVGILAEIPSTGTGNFKREISTTTLFGTNPNGQGFKPSTLTKIFHITIPAGESRAEFYLRDSVRNILTITAFPDPYIGWSAGQKAVWIMDEEEINLSGNRLEFDLQKTSVVAGKFSEPITVEATGADEQPLFLPSTLYFHTESTTGAFYDANFERLPEMITVSQLNPTSNLQFAEGLTGTSATFYYRDDTPGAYLFTVSDNAPLQPDIELANGYAIMSVVGAELAEVDILTELIPVFDDTGRVLDHLVIQPEQTIMLPGDEKRFAVVAYDTDGNPIENALFKWYVIAGGGTIEKDGIDGNSHESLFTAGQDLGIFYDTVLVATLYNGQFGFVTASVQVTDLVDFVGDGLPTTGVGGLQLILMSLTLAAAVGLAWVEHYDKTRPKIDHETHNTSATA